jgi:hypothetical protein
VKLWLVSVKESLGYDAYDSMVVAAATEDQARRIHPHSDDYSWDNGWTHKGRPTRVQNTWVDNPDDLIVECIGTAIEETEAGVILASYNAG